MLHKPRTTLKLKTERLSDRSFMIRLQGELDIYGAGRLEAKIKEIQEAADELVLDLSGLEFMDGSGLRAIVEADNRARSKGSSLKIVEASWPVHKVFRLTGFDQRLQFVPSSGLHAQAEDSPGGLPAT